MSTIDRFEPLSYDRYLKLAELLDCQAPESERRGNPAHDELLFIITHQAYELWFKEILYEIEAVLGILSKNSISDRDVCRSNQYLQRVVKILDVIIGQINILETMTPLDFLDFRDLLTPASGSQSSQFRMLEKKIGVQHLPPQPYNREHRINIQQTDGQIMTTTEEEQPSLFTHVDAWLARMPFLRLFDFDFWSAYRDRVEKMLLQDEATIRTVHSDSPEVMNQQLINLVNTRNEFATIFEPKLYEESLKKRVRRLSHEAFRAALMINLYRDEPIFANSYRLITTLIEIDESLSLWRYRHMQMVSRMIGSKIGSGGTSGQNYLSKTLNTHRVFTDFFNLSTYLLPRSFLPVLPVQLTRELGFTWEQ